MKYENIEQSEVIRRGSPIRKVRGLNKAEFRREFLTGAGLPVIVTDAMDEWKARGKWNFEFFSASYSDTIVIANSPFFLEAIDGLKPVKAEMRLGDYIEYVLNPTKKPNCRFLMGNWEALQSNAIPLYAPGYRIFAEHPNLRQDLNPSPYFIDDFLVRLPAYLQTVLEQLPSPIHYLFFAPKGAVAFLHSDFWETHAYLAQLAGQKFCILFSPDDAEFLYEGEVKDPVYCDLTKYPRFRLATPLYAVLNPGEMLFIPSRWQHFVVTQTPSMTFSYDFFNETNFAPFVSNLFLGLVTMIVEPEKCQTLTSASRMLAEALKAAQSTR